MKELEVRTGRGGLFRPRNPYRTGSERTDSRAPDGQFESAAVRCGPQLSFQVWRFRFGRHYDDASRSSSPGRRTRLGAVS